MFLVIGLFPTRFVEKRKCLLALADGTEKLTRSVFNQLEAVAAYRDMVFPYAAWVAQYLYPLHVA